MAKKHDGPHGWVFSEGEAGTTGTKRYEDGTIRDVAGTDLANAQLNASEIDRVVSAQTAGAAAQNAARAEEIRAHADRVEQGAA